MVSLWTLRCQRRTFAIWTMRACQSGTSCQEGRVLWPTSTYILYMSCYAQCPASISSPAAVALSRPSSPPVGFQVQSSRQAGWLQTKWLSLWATSGSSSHPPLSSRSDFSSWGCIEHTRYADIQYFPYSYRGRRSSSAYWSKLMTGILPRRYVGLPSCLGSCWDSGSKLIFQEVRRLFDDNTE